MEKELVKITVETAVNAPVEKAWHLWTGEEHIIKWNNASPDWHTPRATNDLRTGGNFSCRMEAKDGSFGFDFGGVYDKVVPNEVIAYTIGDGRKVIVKFTEHDGHTHIKETFDAEQQNPVEMQKAGWQSIMDNFRKYAENTKDLEFTITINAPVQKVWDTMLNTDTYKEWVNVSWPGSYYIGKWQQGENLRFLSPGRGGTLVTLVECIPHQLVKAKHIAVIAADGSEDRISDIAKGWIGTTENYFFTAMGNQTELKTQMRMNTEWEKMFSDGWPQAMAKLKEICERSH